MNMFEPRVEVMRPVATEPRQDDLAWPIYIAATAKGMSLRAYAMETDMLTRRSATAAAELARTARAS